jgi:solute carrier family 45 protein 1/2/4
MSLTRSQGIHNIFMVIPQFLVTGLSSIIFAILDPDKSVLHTHAAEDAASGVLARGDGVEVAQKPNSIAIIFR